MCEAKAEEEAEEEEIEKANGVDAVRYDCHRSHPNRQEMLIMQLIASDPCHIRAAPRQRWAREPCSHLLTIWHVTEALRLAAPFGLAAGGSLSQTLDCLTLRFAFALEVLWCRPKTMRVNLRGFVSDLLHHPFPASKLEGKNDRPRLARQACLTVTLIASFTKEEHSFT
eukprot:5447416-Amphidinium_carterae.5